MKLSIPKMPRWWSNNYYEIPVYIIISIILFLIFFSLIIPYIPLLNKIPYLQIYEYFEETDEETDEEMEKNKNKKG